jgi:hypothetical protein
LVLYTIIHPLENNFEQEIPAGTYVFRFTVLDNITAGNIGFAYVDETQGTFSFNSGMAHNQSNKIYTSPPISVSSVWNNIKIWQSENYVSAATGANFALASCYGADPNKTRRVFFAFSNYATPVQLSLDNLDYVIISPTNFYREADVASTLTYYFKDNTGAVVTVPVTFTDCAIAPPAAPTLAATVMLTTDTVAITFDGGPLSIKVYEGNSVRQTISNATSPYTYSPASIGIGQFKFTITTAAGESEKSAILSVNSATNENFCNLYHLRNLGTLSEQSGVSNLKAILFSNSGTLPWTAKIVSDSPLKFIILGKNALNLTAVTLSPQITSQTVYCLAGNVSAADGLGEPEGFPLPPGYEKVGRVYQPTGVVAGTNKTERIRINVTNFCSAAANTVQVGVTQNYAAIPPSHTQVTQWSNGLEAEVITQSGAYPWVFVRDKNNPENVSAATRTLKNA